MAGVEHLLLLRQGIEIWNQRRKKNPTIKPYLREAVLRRMDFSGANLREANLRKADLSGSKLVGANLRSADFRFEWTCRSEQFRAAWGQSPGRHRFDSCPTLRQLDRSEYSASGSPPDSKVGVRLPSQLGGPGGKEFRRCLLPADACFL